MSPFTIEILLSLLGLVLLLFGAFATKTPARTFAWTAIAGCVIGLILLLTGPKSATALPAFVAPFYSVDDLAIFYKGFSLVITALVVWLILESEATLGSYSADGKLAELIGLPVIVCVGMMWMASAKDLVTVFASLELVTISFYVLVAYTRKSALALESGVKYLILGAAATGVLVYGMAWLYGVTGSLAFEGIAKAVANPATNKAGLLFASAFMLAGLGFKVAAAPFHIWVPDVYQGAPTPVTAFLSVGSKAGGFIVLTRMIETFFAGGSIIAVEVQKLLLISAAITILLGSLPALFQTSVKRMLAYSSISHAGFLLLALACADSALTSFQPGGLVAFYLATYLPMTVLAFLVLSVARANGIGDSLDDLRGLSKRSPWLALVMTIAMASLAGVPLTAGFLGKMLVFVNGVAHQFWGVLICAVAGAAAGFYYYLKVILAVYSTSEGAGDEKIRFSPFAKVGGIALAVIVLLLGIYPKPLQSALSSPATPAVAVKP
jgi:NADH-quinone oxidoreductase subunit N